MNEKFGLKFNSNALITDLTGKLAQSVIEVAVDVSMQMRSFAKSERVANSVQLEIIELGRDKISVLVGSDHWMALLDNYGTGTKMDMTNPNLAGYMSGEFWNRPWRTGPQVVGRPPGSYVAPDFDKGTGRVFKTSSGAFWDKKTGRPLPLSENSSKHSWKKADFNAKTPSHFLENAMKLASALLDKELEKAFLSFPWDSDKYLKGGA